jgi:hypothetical protein
MNTDPTLKPDIAALKSRPAAAERAGRCGRGAAMKEQK